MTYPSYGPQQPAYSPQQMPPQPPQQQQPYGYPYSPQQPAYSPQQMPQPPQQPLAQGSLSDYFNQPSQGAGKTLSFTTVGAAYRGIVRRDLTDGDVQQQTDLNGRPQSFRDGRPKLVMTVPLQVQPTQDCPDGQVAWYVKGQAREELARAMSESGAPSGAPEMGAIITVTYVGDRPSGAGLNPAKQFQVTYERPSGQPAVQPQQQAASPQPQAPSAPEQTPMPQPQQPAASPQQTAAPQAPMPQPEQGQPPQQQAPAPPAGLTESQQDLLARLAS